MLACISSRVVKPLVVFYLNDMILAWMVSYCEYASFKSYHYQRRYLVRGLSPRNTDCNLTCWFSMNSIVILDLVDKSSNIFALS